MFMSRALFFHGGVDLVFCCGGVTGICCCGGAEKAPVIVGVEAPTEASEAVDWQVVALVSPVLAVVEVRETIHPCR